MTEPVINQSRPSWEEYFMQLAFVVSRRSTCLSRHVGAIVVKDKRIMTTGYNGAPSGVTSCLEKGFCYRRKIGTPSGEKLELCIGSHAEENAIVQASKFGISLSGGTLYCTHQPCLICSKMIINAGIIKVVFKGKYPSEMSRIMFEEAGVDFIHYSNPIGEIILPTDSEIENCGCEY